MYKESLHSHDRGQERLGLSRESVDSIQRAADRMWYSGGYKKLLGDSYYSNIRDPRQNILGRAVFQRVNQVGKRPRLILATILSKNMKPTRGSDISGFFNTVIKDNDTKLDLPSEYKGMTPIPGSR